MIRVTLLLLLATVVTAHNSQADHTSDTLNDPEETKLEDFRSDLANSLAENIKEFMSFYDFDEWGPTEHSDLTTGNFIKKNLKVSIGYLERHFNEKENSLNGELLQVSTDYLLTSVDKLIETTYYVLDNQRFQTNDNASKTLTDLLEAGLRDAKIGLYQTATNRSLLHQQLKNIKNDFKVDLQQTVESGINNALYIMPLFNTSAVAADIREEMKLALKAMYENLEDSRLEKMIKMTEKHLQDIKDKMAEVTSAAKHVEEFQMEHSHKEWRNYGNNPKEL